MKIDDETEVLRQQVARLEAGGSSVEEWRALESRVFHALLEAQMQLVANQRAMIERVRAGQNDWSWVRSHTVVHDLLAYLEELRLMRLCAQSRIFEHEAAAAQRPAL